MSSHKHGINTKFTFVSQHLLSTCLWLIVFDKEFLAEQKKKKSLQTAALDESQTTSGGRERKKNIFVLQTAETQPALDVGAERRPSAPWSNGGFELWVVRAVTV